MKQSFGEDNFLRINFLIGVAALLGTVGGIFYVTKRTKILSQFLDKKPKKSSRDICNICFKNLNKENFKICVICCNCKKIICRGKKCSVWLPNHAEWECKLCFSSNESRSRTKEWINHQDFLYNQFQKSMKNLRSGYSTPVRVYNTNDDYSNYFNNNQMHSLPPFFPGYDETKRYTVHADDSISKMFNEHFTEKEYLSQYEQNIIKKDYNNITNPKLKSLVERIVEEILNVPALLTNISGITDDNSCGSSNHNNNSNRNLSLSTVDPENYQEYLATAILNKLTDSFNNCEKRFESNTTNFDKNFNAITNEKFIFPSQSSSSIEPQSDCSLTDPINEISHRNLVSPCESCSNLGSDYGTRNLMDNDDIKLNDYVQSHRIPLPSFSVSSESADDEFISVTTSNGQESTWEDNWLFKKKKFGSDTSVGMLVPAPKEDIRALIGDKTADEMSDLSEAGSDYEDFNNNAENINPDNVRIHNRNVISRKSNVGLIDELIEQTSFISSSSLPDNETTLVIARNENILGNSGSQTIDNRLNTNDVEVINNNLNLTSEMDQTRMLIHKTSTGSFEEPIIEPPCDFTDDETITSQLSSTDALNSAKDLNDESDIQSSKHIKDVNINPDDKISKEKVDSTIDDTVSQSESTSRKHSVIELLAVVALGPVLALSAPEIDGYVIRTTEEMKALRSRAATPTDESFRNVEIDFPTTPIHKDNISTPNLMSKIKITNSQKDDYADSEVKNRQENQSDNESLTVSKSEEALKSCSEKENFITIESETPTQCESFEISNIQASPQETVVELHLVTNEISTVQEPLLETNTVENMKSKITIDQQSDPSPQDAIQNAEEKLDLSTKEILKVQETEANAQTVGTFSQDTNNNTEKITTDSNTIQEPVIDSQCVRQQKLKNTTDQIVEEIQHNTEKIFDKNTSQSSANATDTSKEEELEIQKTEAILEDMVEISHIISTDSVALPEMIVEVGTGKVHDQEIIIYQDSKYTLQSATETKQNTTTDTFEVEKTIAEIKILDESQPEVECNQNSEALLQGAVKTPDISTTNRNTTTNEESEKDYSPEITCSQTVEAILQDTDESSSESTKNLCMVESKQTSEEIKLEVETDQNGEASTQNTFEETDKSTLDSHAIQEIRAEKQVLEQKEIAVTTDQVSVQDAVKAPEATATVLTVVLDVAIETEDEENSVHTITTDKNTEAQTKELSVSTEPVADTQTSDDLRPKVEIEQNGEALLQKTTETQSVEEEKCDSTTEQITELILHNRSEGKNTITTESRATQKPDIKTILEEQNPEITTQLLIEVALQDTDKNSNKSTINLCIVEEQVENTPTSQEIKLDVETDQSSTTYKQNDCRKTDDQTQEIDSETQSLEQTEYVVTTNQVPEIPSQDAVETIVVISEDSVIDLPDYTTLEKQNTITKEPCVTQKPDIETILEEQNAEITIQLVVEDTLHDIDENSNKPTPDLFSVEEPVRSTLVSQEFKLDEETDQSDIASTQGDCTKTEEHTQEIEPEAHVLKKVEDVVTSNQASENPLQDAVERTEDISKDSVTVLVAVIEAQDDNIKQPDNTNLDKQNTIMIDPCTAEKQVIETILEEQNAEITIQHNVENALQDTDEHPNEPTPDLCVVRESEERTPTSLETKLDAETDQSSKTSTRNYCTKTYDHIQESDPEALAFKQSEDVVTTNQASEIPLQESVETTVVISEDKVTVSVAVIEAQDDRVKQSDNTTLEKPDNTTAEPCVTENPVIETILEEQNAEITTLQNVGNVLRNTDENSNEPTPDLCVVEEPVESTPTSLETKLYVETEHSSIISAQRDCTKIDDHIQESGPEAQALKHLEDVVNTNQASQNPLQDSIETIVVISEDTVTVSVAVIEGQDDKVEESDNKTSEKHDTTTVEPCATDKSVIETILEEQNAEITTQQNLENALQDTDENSCESTPDLCVVEEPVENAPTSREIKLDAETDQSGIASTQRDCTKTVERTQQSDPQAQVLEQAEDVVTTNQALQDAVEETEEIAEDLVTVLVPVIEAQDDKVKQSDNTTLGKQNTIMIEPGATQIRVIETILEEQNAEITIQNNVENALQDTDEHSNEPTPDLCVVEEPDESTTTSLETQLDTETGQSCITSTQNDCTKTYDHIQDSDPEAQAFKQSEDVVTTNQASEIPLQEAVETTVVISEDKVTVSVAVIEAQDDRVKQSDNTTPEKPDNITTKPCGAEKPVIETILEEQNAEITIQLVIEDTLPDIDENSNKPTPDLCAVLEPVESTLASQEFKLDDEADQSGITSTKRDCTKTDEHTQESEPEAHVLKKFEDVVTTNQSSDVPLQDAVETTDVISEDSVTVLVAVIEAQDDKVEQSDNTTLEKQNTIMIEPCATQIRVIGTILEEQNVEITTQEDVEDALQDTDENSNDPTPDLCVVEEPVKMSQKIKLDVKTDQSIITSIQNDCPKIDEHTQESDPDAQALSHLEDVVTTNQASEIPLQDAVETTVVISEDKVTVSVDKDKDKDDKVKQLDNTPQKSVIETILEEQNAEITTQENVEDVLEGIDGNSNEPTPDSCEVEKPLESTPTSQEIKLDAGTDQSNITSTQSACVKTDQLSLESSATQGINFETQSLEQTEFVVRTNQSSDVPLKDAVERTDVISEESVTVLVAVIEEQDDKVKQSDNVTLEKQNTIMIEPCATQIRVIETILEEQNVEITTLQNVEVSLPDIGENINKSAKHLTVAQKSHESVDMSEKIEPEPETAYNGGTISENAAKSTENSILLLSATKKSELQKEGAVYTDEKYDSPFIDAVDTLAENTGETAEDVNVGLQKIENTCEQIAEHTLHDKITKQNTITIEEFATKEAVLETIAEVENTEIENQQNVEAFSLDEDENSNKPMTNSSTVIELVADIQPSDAVRTELGADKNGEAPTQEDAKKAKHPKLDSPVAKEIDSETQALEQMEIVVTTNQKYETPLQNVIETADAILRHSEIDVQKTERITSVIQDSFEASDVNTTKSLTALDTVVEEKSEEAQKPSNETFKKQNITTIELCATQKQLFETIIEEQNPESTTQLNIDACSQDADENSNKNITNLCVVEKSLKSTQRSNEIKPEVETDKDTKSLTLELFVTKNTDSTNTFETPDENTSDSSENLDVVEVQTKALHEIESTKEQIVTHALHDDIEKQETISTESFVAPAAIFETETVKYHEEITAQVHKEATFQDIDENSKKSTTDSSAFTVLVADTQSLEVLRPEVETGQNSEANKTLDASNTATIPILELVCEAKAEGKHIHEVVKVSSHDSDENTSTIELLLTTESVINIETSKEQRSEIQVDQTTEDFPQYSTLSSNKIILDSFETQEFLPETANLDGQNLSITSTHKSDSMIKNAVLTNIITLDPCASTKSVIQNQAGHNNEITQEFIEENSNNTIIKATTVEEIVISTQSSEELNSEFSTEKKTSDSPATQDVNLETETLEQKDVVTIAQKTESELHMVTEASETIIEESEATIDVVVEAKTEEVQKTDGTTFECCFDVITIESRTTQEVVVETIVEEQRSEIEIQQNIQVSSQYTNESLNKSTEDLCVAKEPIESTQTSDKIKPEVEIDQKSEVLIKNYFKETNQTTLESTLTHEIESEIQTLNQKEVAVPTDESSKVSLQDIVEKSCTSTTGSTASSDVVIKAQTEEMRKPDITTEQTVDQTLPDKIEKQDTIRIESCVTPESVFDTNMKTSSENTDEISNISVVEEPIECTKTSEEIQYEVETDQNCETSTQNAYKVTNKSTLNLVAAQEMHLETIQTPEEQKSVDGTPDTLTTDSNFTQELIVMEPILKGQAPEITISQVVEQDTDKQKLGAMCKEQTKVVKVVKFDFDTLSVHDRENMVNICDEVSDDESSEAAFEALVSELVVTPTGSHLSLNLLFDNKTSLIEAVESKNDINVVGMISQTEDTISTSSCTDSSHAQISLDRNNCSNVKNKSFSNASNDSTNITNSTPFIALSDTSMNSIILLDRRSSDSCTTDDSVTTVIDGNENSSRSSSRISQNILSSDDTCENSSINTNQTNVTFSSTNCTTCDTNNCSVCNLKNLQPGSIAERERRKWLNAVEMPNNPYSAEALKRRLSDGPEKLIDIPNINSPLEATEEKFLPSKGNISGSLEGTIARKDKELKRYSRDYYINQDQGNRVIKNGSDRTSASPIIVSTNSKQEDIKNTQPSNNVDDKISQNNFDIYFAKVVRVREHNDQLMNIIDNTSNINTNNIDIVSHEQTEYSSEETIIEGDNLLIRNCSTPSSIISCDDQQNLLQNTTTDSSLTSGSEDSDNKIRIYDLNKQETRIIRESSIRESTELATNITSRPTILSITKKLCSQKKVLTPAALKFLQPKRRIIHPDQIMTSDNEGTSSPVFEKRDIVTPTTPTTPVINKFPEKNVIEPEVVSALPSVKALAQAYLLSAKCSTKHSHNLKNAKARASLVETQVIDENKSKPSPDSYVPPYQQVKYNPIEPESENNDTIGPLNTEMKNDVSDADNTNDNNVGERRISVVLEQGYLQNNIAFFENLKKN